MINELQKGLDHNRSMHRNNLSLFFILSVILCMMMLFAGCGGEAEKNVPKEKGQTISQRDVTVMNYDFSGSPRKVNFTGVPERVIVCGCNAADTLLALGLNDKVVYMCRENPGETEKYKQELPHATVLEHVLSKEAALMAEPQLILAMRRYFSEKSLGGMEFWKKHGINCYIQDASGPIPGLGNFPPCNIESEKTFIVNMGKIFDKEKEAESIIFGIDKTLADEKALLKGKKPNVLVIEFMDKYIEVFGKKLLCGDIIQKLGGNVVDYGQAFISMEDLLTMDCDVVMVVYHGDDEDAKKAVEHMRQGMLQRMQAVKNGRIYPLNYQLIVAPGVHTESGIKVIGDAMRK